MEYNKYRLGIQSRFGLLLVCDKSKIATKKNELTNFEKNI